MTAGELGSLEAALAEMSSLKEALSSANLETEAVRAKLHNAVRKGKTIDLERKKAVSEVDELKQQLSAARSELEELQGKEQTQLAVQDQNADLAKELQASCARAAALDERLKQVEAESMETLQAMEQKHHAADEVLQQQIASLQSALSKQVLPTQEQSKALQEAHVRAEEAERQVVELREEAEVMNEALQVPSTILSLISPLLDTGIHCKLRPRSAQEVDDACLYMRLQENALPVLRQQQGASRPVQQRKQPRMLKLRRAAMSLPL